MDIDYMWKSKKKSFYRELLVLWPLHNGHFRYFILFFYKILQLKSDSHKLTVSSRVTAMGVWEKEEISFSKTLFNETLIFLPLHNGQFYCNAIF